MFRALSLSVSLAGKSLRANLARARGEHTCGVRVRVRGSCTGPRRRQRHTRDDAFTHALVRPTNYTGGFLRQIEIDDISVRGSRQRHTRTRTLTQISTTENIVCWRLRVCVCVGAVSNGLQLKAKHIKKYEFQIHQSELLVTLPAITARAFRITFTVAHDRNRRHSNVTVCSANVHQILWFSPDH